MAEELSQKDAAEQAEWELRRERKQGEAAALRGSTALYANTLRQALQEITHYNPDRAWQLWSGLKMFQNR